MTGKAMLQSHSSKQSDSMEAVDVSVIMPAFNEEKVIESVIAATKTALDREDYSYELLVVDDGSGDSTATIAQGAGAKVISHPYNIGNGAAVKTGIRNARGRMIVLLDADGQHDPNDIPILLEDLQTFDMSVGARTSKSETSAHRDLANSIFNILASYVANRRISDLTSGFRAIRTPIARQFVYLLPNSYSYPTTITLSVIKAGYSVNYRPIQTKKRVGKSGIRLIFDGTRFLMIIMKITVFFSPMRIFLPASVFLFVLGACWYVFSVFFASKGFPPTSMLLLLTSVIVFCFGLISEQINEVRNDRRS